MQVFCIFLLLAEYAKPIKGFLVLGVIHRAGMVKQELQQLYGRRNQPLRPENSTMAVTALIPWSNLRLWRPRHRTRCPLQQLGMCNYQSISQTGGMGTQYACGCRCCLHIFTLRVLEQVWCVCGVGCGGICVFVYVAHTAIRQSARGLPT